jgi:hypothetical protein
MKIADGDSNVGSTQTTMSGIEVMHSLLDREQQRSRLPPDPFAPEGS